MQATLDLPAIDESMIAPQTTAAPVPATTAPSQPVTLMAAALAPFDAIESGIKALAQRYTEVAFDCATTKGLAAAKAARQDLRENGRYAIQRAADTFKTDANGAKKAVDARAEALIALLLPAEKNADDQIKAEEKRKADEKAERERLATERREGFARRLDAIRAYATRCNGLPSDRIAKGIAMLRDITIDDDWEEFEAEAGRIKADTLAAMQRLHDDAAKREADDAERERLRADNERLQALIAQQAQAAAAAQITPHTEESGSSPADAPAPGTPGSYASSGALAARALPSGDEGTDAHADDCASTPAQDSQRHESGVQPDPDATGDGTMARNTDDAAPVGGLAEGEAVATAAVSPGLRTLEVEGLALPPLGGDDGSLETSEREAIEPVGLIVAPTHASDDLGDLLVDCQALVAHLELAFRGRFPSHPKPEQEWWTTLRAQLALLSPRLAVSTAKVIR